jgi:hypothetical protein
MAAPLIRCPSCEQPAPISERELVGDAGGDPSLLPILIPPDGWIGDPDGDGLLCGDCAPPRAINDWMDDFELAEQLTHGRADAGLDPADAALIFGVWPDDGE